MAKAISNALKTKSYLQAPMGLTIEPELMRCPPDRAERFLYQEFVRNKHAERVRFWVAGRETELLGVSNEIFTEINKLLEPLGEQFRQDLGLVCESHHLSDLNDRKKYKVTEPYGDSAEETANVQYCAILLRTADLLHITSDRTPSITFKVINPTDPLSQEEWAKQRAVRRIVPKLGLDQDGSPSEKATKDTIEVYAYFTSQEGFFGLTTYLTYCTEQLKLSNQWISNANKEQRTKHEFPWRRIDDSNIQTKGFIRDTFEFSIDQAKILDLLTGHTLYNDIRVVLREVVQNALDAIRIENYPESSLGKGVVNIRWDSVARVLSITDNGTGMTQKFVSDFLLKVGTSRYQDPEFKKEYPNFSSISRFGIGVLSTFMIADSVTIVTCHPDDAQARQLTLRSVHGKYLIQLLEKNETKVQHVYPHGTSFEMRLRPSVKMDDPVQVARMWVVVPGCDVFVTVDGKDPVRIGHKSPANAVVAVINEMGGRADIADISAPLDDPSKSTIRVVERDIDGVTVAYAVAWSPLFREWSFLPAPERGRRTQSTNVFLGTCIEGIRVEFQTPGYLTPAILSIANVTGPNSPKTNVARSGIEATQERDDMLRSIYQIYRQHIASEIVLLSQTREYSLTGAVEEARYLVHPLLSGPTSKTLLEEELSRLEVLAVENNSEREIISPATLSNEDAFWTIECVMLQPAEQLIRQAKTSASLAHLVGALGMSEFVFPSGRILCGTGRNSTFGQYAYQNREVDKVDIDRDQRRIDLRWTNVDTPPRWLSYPGLIPEFLRHLISSDQARLDRNEIQISSIYVPTHDVIVNKEVGVALMTIDSIYLMPATAPTAFLTEPLKRLADEPNDAQNQIAAAFYLSVVEKCLRYMGKVSEPERLVIRELNNWTSFLGSEFKLTAATEVELISLVGETDWTTFAPSKWSRRDSN